MNRELEERYLHLDLGSIEVQVTLDEDGVVVDVFKEGLLVGSTDRRDIRGFRWKTYGEMGGRS